VHGNGRSVYEAGEIDGGGSHAFECDSGRGGRSWVQCGGRTEVAFCGGADGAVAFYSVDCVA